MKQAALTIAALFWATGAWAQGVRDPATPNHNVIIVNPPQPSPPRATRNIPSAIQAPPILEGGQTQPYYGNRTRGSTSNLR